MTGTRKSTEDYGDGNWTNPYVQAENQRAQEEAQSYSHSYTEPAEAPYSGGTYLPDKRSQAPASAPVASYAPPPRRQRRRPAFSLARRFFCTLLALLTLATGLGAATCLLYTSPSPRDRG